jgi:hypothetical protein
MKKIRKGVFETNSSSTHSISIGISDGKAQFDTLPIDSDGVCRVYQAEFGWEQETFNSPSMKASYAYTYAKGDLSKMRQLGDVIQKQLGGKITVEFVEGDGYIDHQSFDVCEEAFESDDKLRNFIFNPRSYLETGNDNC